MVNSEGGWRGGENQVFLLARDLPAPWRPVTVCQPGSPLALRLREAGREVVELAMSGGGDLGAARRIRRLARELGARVLHAHTSHAHALCRLALVGSELPFVVTRRVDFPVKRGLFARWKYGPRVTRFAAISQEVRRVLLAGGVDEARCVLIPSGVDFSRLDQAAPVDLRAELGLPAGTVLVGNAAALVDHKDHRTLLEAWAAVERAMPSAWLAIAGEGELGGALRAHAAALGLARVRFLGFRADVPGLLKGLDLFVMSSHLEGLGTSIMDAMRCGLAVVATRAGGIPELVEDGGNGLLVGVRDAPALAAALLRALGDGALRARLAAGARASAEARFSHRRMVEGYARLYADIAGAAASPAAGRP
jgi:glycosyltransferase involved in cell wall biosynthesis